MREVLGRLSALAEASGMPASAVAEQVGIEERELARSLRGERALSTVEIVRLADTLQVSVHWLLTGEPDPLRVTISGPAQTEI